MKRLLPLITVMLILSLTLASSASTNVLSGPNNSLYMWEIKPENDSSGSNIIYILGSLQISDTSIFPLDSRIENAYSDCSRLIVETDSSKITQDQTVTALLKYGMLSKTTIDKILSKDQYNQADSLIKKYTQNKKSLSNYKSFMPWVIDNLITNLAFSSSKDFVQNGVASYFTDKAHKDGKAITEVESVDSQLSVLGSTSYSLQIAALEKTIDFVGKGSEAVKNATALWKNGDVKGLSELYSFDNNSTLPDRNKKASDYFAKCIKSGGKYFAIVDASRLTGNNSIIDLFLQKGYKVEQK